MILRALLCLVLEGVELRRRRRVPWVVMEEQRRGIVPRQDRLSTLVLRQSGAINGVVEALCYSFLL